MTTPEPYEVSEGVFEGAVIPQAFRQGTFLLNDVTAEFLCLLEVAIYVVDLEDD